jgi:hypothetical protein
MPGAGHVLLARQHGGEAEALGSFSLLGSSDATLQLRVEPRPDDGGVVELTVRADGAFVGVAIDPAPLPFDGRVRIAAEGGCRSIAPATDP